MTRATTLILPLLVALQPTYAGTAALSSGAAPATGDQATARGTLVRRVLLTGELEAARATPIVVPRTRRWNVEIRWLVEDGSRVRAGDRVVEFDNTALLTRLEELKLQLFEARNALLQAGFEARGATAEKELAVDRTRIELEKARLAASVPPELLSRLELEELRLAVTRAQTEHAKALEQLEAERQTRQADLAIRRLEVDKAGREMELVESSLAALTLTSPAPGVVLVADHPWDDRKLQVGDSVWTGYPVLTIPDPSSMQVRAELLDVDDGRVRPGMGASCYLDAYSLEPYRCRIATISPIARQVARDGLRRSFEVVVELERTDSERMRPGMSVRVEVEAETLSGVRLAPRAAVDFSHDPPRLPAPAGVAGDLAVGPCNALDCALLEGETGTGADQRPRASKPAGGQSVESTMAATAPPREDNVESRRRPPPTPVAERLVAWARAWSDRDADAYLAFYGSAFRPPDGLDRDTWEAQRRVRVRRPAWIQVSVDLLEPGEPTAEGVVLRFLQTYASDRFRSVVWKRQTWSLEEGEWKILDERVEPVEERAVEGGNGE